MSWLCSSCTIVRGSGINTILNLFLSKNYTLPFNLNVVSYNWLGAERWLISCMSSSFLKYWSNSIQSSCNVVTSLCDSISIVLFLDIRSCLKEVNKKLRVSSDQWRHHNLIDRIWSALKIKNLIYMTLITTQWSTKFKHISLLQGISRGPCSLAVTSQTVILCDTRPTPPGSIGSPYITGIPC